MFMTYMNHLGHGDSPREMIVATVLHVLKAGAKSSAKEVPMGQFNTIYQTIADNAKKPKSSPIKPPIAALDYRTHEGRHKKTNEAQWQSTYRNSTGGPNPAMTSSLHLKRNVMQLRKG